MLESLRIQDFRCHRDTTVRFGRLTALVGPNGSGKSSVLEVFKTLHTNPVLNPVDQVVEGMPRPCVRVGATEACFMAAEHRNGPANVWFVHENQHGQTFVAVSRRGSREAGDHASRTVPALLAHMQAARQFEIVPSVVGSPSLLVDPDVSLDTTGANTAAVLAAIKIRDDAQFDRIGAMLRKVVPSVERLRVAPARIANETSVGWEVHLDVRGVGTLPASTLSQGTRMTLALVTALCAPAPPSIALFDEIDHALHPRAQLELLRQLRALLDVFPTLQIVFTTHSPYMLDGLSPDEVQVFALHDDGTARVRSLSEHPGAKQADGVLSAGELWSLSDEAEWVLAP